MFSQENDFNCIMKLAVDAASSQNDWGEGPNPQLALGVAGGKRAWGASSRLGLVLP